MQKGLIILTIILAQGLCPLKVEIARLPIGFRLKVSLSNSAYVHVHHNKMMRRLCRQQSELSSFASPAIFIGNIMVCYKTIDSCF